MTHTFDTFVHRVRELLMADPGPQGREQVRQFLEEVLLSPGIVALLGDDQPQRRDLYEDPELGFVILGHVYHEAKRTSPHDHGTTWAIYGQVSGESIMDEWSIVEEAVGDQPGLVKLSRTYYLRPGKAHLYNEGVLHAPRREAPAKLIRIEGGHIGKRRKWRIAETPAA